MIAAWGRFWRMVGQAIHGVGRTVERYGEERCGHAWVIDPATGAWRCMWCDVPSDGGPHPGPCQGALPDRDGHG